MSANVAGRFGTTRISLNDNLLNHTSAPEIKAVMGHEMGHYVLNHAIRFVVYYALILGNGFWLVERGLARALQAWGARWGVRDRGDPDRSDESRVGKEGGCTCRYRWSQFH